MSGTSAAAASRIRSPNALSIAAHRSWPQIGAGRNTRLPNAWS